MSLLQRLREAQRLTGARSSPARASPSLGQMALAQLSPATIEAMTRVVEHEMPAIRARLAAARAVREVERLMTPDADRPALGPASPRHLPARVSSDPVPERCPQCGGTGTTVSHIDLTVGRSWFECRDCGLRFEVSSMDESGNATRRF